MGKKASVVSYYDNTNMHALNSLACVQTSHQIMLILCGIPGSGKSTYARSILESLSEPYKSSWESLNQDAIGTRQKVENRAMHALRSRKSIIIDRCNFDVEQRAHWIKIAREFNIDTVYCLLMPSFDDVALCAKRAEKRGADGVHEGGIKWYGVCHRMQAGFVLPTLNEGYSGLFTCSNERDLVCFRNSIQDIALR
jgi:hypothetical protein